MSGAEEGIYFSNVRGDRDSTAVFRPRWTRAQTEDQVARRAEMKPRRRWCVAQGEVRVRVISGEMIRDRRSEIRQSEEGTRVDVDSTCCNAERLTRSLRESGVAR